MFNNNSQYEMKLAWESYIVRKQRKIMDFQQQIHSYERCSSGPKILTRKNEKQQNLKMKNMRTDYRILSFSR